VIYVICIFVVTTLVVSMIQHHDGAADTHATVEPAAASPHHPRQTLGSTILDFSYFVLDRYFTV
jgi:hypothetical protein